MMIFFQTKATVSVKLNIKIEIYFWFCNKLV